MTMCIQRPSLNRFLRFLGATAGQRFHWLSLSTSSKSLWKTELGKICTEKRCVSEQSFEPNPWTAELSERKPPQGKASTAWCVFICIYTVYTHAPIYYLVCVDVFKSFSRNVQYIRALRWGKQNKLPLELVVLRLMHKQSRFTLPQIIL